MLAHSRIITKESLKDLKVDSLMRAFGQLRIPHNSSLPKEYEETKQALEKHQNRMKNLIRFQVPDFSPLSDPAFRAQVEARWNDFKSRVSPVASPELTERIVKALHDKKLPGTEGK